VKAAHGGEVVGEGVGVSGLQLLNQELDVGGDELLFGVGLLAVDGGDGAGVGFAAHGVFSFVVAFAFHAMRGMYLHAERLLAKAGVARRNGEGYLPPLERSRRRNGKGEAQRRSAQAQRGRLGRPLAPRDRGSAPERT